MAIAAGRKLCEQLLEPLQETFGRLAIRSAYRAPAVNEFGNRHGLGCASNLRNYGRHIWDRRDAEGAMLRANIWNESVSRVELDQQARDARLRLERIERLLVCHSDRFLAQARPLAF